MNVIAVSAEEVPLPVWYKKCENFALKVLADRKIDDWELSLCFCTNSFIKNLNKTYRGKDEATDVLSFPQDDSAAGEGKNFRAAGDVVISLDALKENAELFAVSEDEELRRLLVHGILHLEGMDHETNEAAEPMLIIQENILKNLRGEKIL